MKPAIPLTDSRFQYVNAVSTNLAERFAKVRAAQQKTVSQQAADTKAVCNVFNDRRKKEIEAKETALRG